MHLRRHIATMSQIVNLESNGLENLATFLGHDINVHREYYRLPENTYQLAKCTKMLIAAKRGMGHFAGKKFDEIDFNIEGNIMALLNDINNHCFEPGYKK